MIQYKNAKSITKELRLIAEYRNINACKSMPKDKLSRILNNKNNNRGDRKTLFKSKKEENKESLYKPKRNSLFKLKRKKLRKCLTSQKKKHF